MLKNIRGVSLIEVLAVSVIVVLVLGGIYSFSISSQRIYRTGANTSELLSTLRLTAERVSREVRFADYIEILDSWDLALAEPENYIYVFYDSSSNTLMRLDETGSRALSQGLITEVSFSLDESNLLFTLNGQRGRTTSKLDSSAPLLNIDDVSPGDSGVAIRFTKPSGLPSD